MLRRANVTITILVIGIFAVCSLALISFIVSKVNTRDHFSGLGLMEKINSQIEAYSVHDDLSKVDTKINNEGKRVFYQEKKKSSGILWWKKDIVVFSVEYGVP